LVADKAKLEWWEQVILLVGAHPGTPEDVREELITRLLETVETHLQNSETRFRYHLLTGNLARDMGDELPVAQFRQVEAVLFKDAVDLLLTPVARASAADTLEELGYTPADLYEFIPIENGPTPNLYMAKYPVANAQYERFLKSDFGNLKYWTGFPKYDENSAIMPGQTWGAEAWDWLERELKNKDNLVEEGVLYPRYWRDPRFGITRRGAPVVGVSWYEANAYCNWLKEHWDQEEGAGNSFKPRELRLPTEVEWAFSAGGEDPKERFPWDQKGATKEIEEIVQRANVRESEINRTAPVWMYPLGAGTKGVMDMSGNVWEWQANFSDREERFLGLRGGSWDNDEDFARVSIRSLDLPLYRYLIIGFRVVAFPSG
jgi:formylglycine-generating enzyme required for sulfatase activity